MIRRALIFAFDAYASIRDQERRVVTRLRERLEAEELAREAAEKAASESAKEAERWRLSAQEFRESLQDARADLVQAAAGPWLNVSGDRCAAMLRQSNDFDRFIVLYREPSAGPVMIINYRTACNIHANAIRLEKLPPIGRDGAQNQHDVRAIAEIKIPKR